MYFHSMLYLYVKDVTPDYSIVLLIYEKMRNLFLIIKSFLLYLKKSQNNSGHKKKNNKYL